MVDWLVAYRLRLAITTGQKARAVRHVTRWVLTPPLERVEARNKSSKYTDNHIQNQADEQKTK